MPLQKNGHKSEIDICIILAVELVSIVGTAYEA